MNLPQHATGPWYARHGLNQLVDGGTCVADARRNRLHAGWLVFSDAETHGDEESDARLIAAAPRMLDALLDAENEILNLLEDLSDSPEDDLLANRTLATIRDAIAAATGKEAA